MPAPRAPKKASWMRRAAGSLFSRKTEPSHVDAFLLTEDPTTYITAFRGLPKTDTPENAKTSIQTLRTLQRDYSKTRDQGGLRHVKLIAEIGEHQAILQGKPELSTLYTRFLTELTQTTKTKTKENKKKKRRLTQS